MILTAAAAVALLAQGAAETPANDVAFDSLARGRNAEAIAIIDADEAIEAADPARLINLGIAYARTGNDSRARAYFEAAMQSEDRVSLETADGQWIDSARLARKALKMLDKGEFRTERVAMQ